ncbi:uncharacterized protein LOC142527868 [Primulina tabacum]|uniref:uncharacterized protein LOC142527868 n=1 Tax=Primulina tabacum TaxID=48773 RepID=UPI003F5A1D36
MLHIGKSVKYSHNLFPYVYLIFCILFLVLLTRFFPRFTLQCVFPPRFVGRTKRNLQDFVVINEERSALIHRLWEEFLQTEAPYLTKNVHNMRIILGMRLFVNILYGLSIGTTPSSTILFDPPTPQAEELRLWVKANREYADTVISQKLYEKAYQSVDQPFDFQIRKIRQILSLTETPAQVVPNLVELLMAMNSLAFTAMTVSQAQNHSYASKQIYLMEAGSLHVYVEHQEAEILLVRTSRTEARGRTFVRNTVIACLPPFESSSTSWSSEEKGLSSHVQKELLPAIPTPESQESTSNT